MNAMMLKTAKLMAQRHFSINNNIVVITFHSRNCPAWPCYQLLIYNHRKISLHLQLLSTHHHSWRHRMVLIPHLPQCIMEPLRIFLRLLSSVRRAYAPLSNSCTFWISNSHRFREKYPRASQAPECYFLVILPRLSCMASVDFAVEILTTLLLETREADPWKSCSSSTHISRMPVIPKSVQPTNLSTSSNILKETWVDSLIVILHDLWGLVTIRTPTIWMALKWGSV